jgi:hypothetical protein
MKKLRLMVACVMAMAVGQMAYGIPTQVDKDDMLGTVDPGSPADPGTEAARLQFLVDNLNKGNVSLFPQVRDYSGQVQAASDSQTSILIPLTQNYDYLLAKWANVDVFYYINGLSGTLNLVNDVVFNKNLKPQGLSHYTLFNGTPVPDGGSTVALIGLAFAGLAFFRRKLN